MEDKIFIIFIMLGMLICGASNTISKFIIKLAAKWQDTFHINGAEFNHPFMYIIIYFLFYLYFFFIIYNKANLRYVFCRNDGWNNVLYKM